MSDNTYHIPNTWLVKTDGDALIISGGADVTYQLDITDNPKTKFATIKNKPYNVEALSDNDKIVHEQLLAGGISVPRLPQKSTLKVRSFGTTLDNVTYDHARIVTSDTYDLGIVLYSKGTFAALLQKIDYQQIQKPHILIDTTNFQNISVGPLVFPGETACLACLQGRLEYRWGDNEKPSNPRANSQHKLVEAIIDREIQRFIDQNFQLIGQTIALNFDDYTTVKHPLYKLDKCPICKKPEIDRLTVIA